MDINPLHAADPYRNATVSASAGTGKTWMLTTRIVRLLLADAPPASILAITFTRKAAGEMRQRVSDRLLELYQASDEERGKLLAMMGEASDAATVAKAKQLYPELLAANQTIRISTFHSFCQDILQGFPLEADIPAGFELLQQAGLTLDLAWDALNQEATKQPEGEIALALDQLFDLLKTLHTTQKTLYRFVEQRTDWWAYTEGQTEPCEWAITQLKQQLDVPDEPYFLIAQLDRSLDQFNQQLLLRKSNASIKKFQGAIELARSAIANQDLPAAQQALCDAFLTKDFKPRAYKHTGVLDKELKAQAAEHIALFNDICAALLRTRDNQLRQRALELNSAWYTVGSALIERYQQLKEQRRQLDFGDLEWKTYQLLHHADNADWVQYKLDQRINHLLFDEFQDTNPTQWQLIRPLLDELAAGEQERHRSVFLVGDIKQSIYSFRRANPDLQVQASQWLQDHLQAEDFPLNLSRRSSPTVIDSVNHIFETPDMLQRLPSFVEHGTFQQDLWGRFELHPLATSAPADEVEIIPGENLRNPLTHPRVEVKRDHRYREGQLIAQRIHTLIAEGVEVAGEEGLRPLHYGDIYILLKSRSHVADYERALRERGIPYLGTEKGTFLDNMEISDMDVLLNFLNMPFDNHRLAVILRSPLFHASEEDLIALAQCDVHKNWWQRLCHLCEQQQASITLRTAQQQLADWLALTPALPVHDLLDHIYHTGRVLQRYSGAVKAEKAESTRANLIRFLEMALEMDSGRYPSLTRFLDQLKRLRNKDSATDKPDNADVGGDAQRVQFLTVHASKGLEAPVVFLADTFGSDSSKEAWNPMVEWPSDSDRPTHFMLTPPKGEMCELHQELAEHKAKRDSLEGANLLYVALTRAKHMLVVTGSCREEIADKDNDSWYQLIAHGIKPHATEDEETWVISNGSMTYAPAQASPAASNQQHSFDLAPPFDWSPVPPPAHTNHEIAPSKIDSEYEGGSGDEHAMARGNYIHHLLEAMTQPHPFPHTADNSLPEPIRLACEAEAKQLLNNEALRFLFDPQQYQSAKKEVGLQYPVTNGQWVYGVIDRLVETKDAVYIVDYKSHQHVNADNATELAEHYRPQMEYYRQGVQQILPHKPIRIGIVFTHNQQWVEL